MGRFTKRLILGLAAALVLTGGAFADFLLDDMEGGSNENKMGFYWYYFVGDDDRIAATLAQDVANNGYKQIITNAGPGDQYGDLTFTPHAGSGKTGASAAMLYQSLNYANLNSCTKEDGCERYPTIGMGTSLTVHDDSGYGAGFNSVSSIKFWMKAKDVDTVFFKVETIENSVTGPYGPTNITGGWWPANKNDLPGKYDKNPSNAWMKKIHPTSEWVEYTVAIDDATGVTSPGTAITGDVCGGTKPGPCGTAGDLKQDAWWGFSYAFKKANVTKLAWQINNDKNTSKAGELYVDDVRLIGSFTYVPKDQCLSCPGVALPATGKKYLISDFEDSNDPLKNALGFYWYPYTDVNARTDGSDPTRIEGPWTINQHTEEDMLDVAGNGKGGGAGVKIEYALGASPFEQTRDGVTQKLTAFAGIGTNLFDTTAMLFFNAKGATGIYFDYKTTNVDFLAVEFSDVDDIAVAGKNGDNDDGQVFYKKIPGSAEWKSAVIPFDSLVLPSWLKAGDRRYGTKLKLEQLAKIQFKYTGTTNGTIAIDNLYFLGIEGGGAVDTTPPNVGVKHLGAKAMASALRATYSRGVVGVNWNAAQAVAGGKVQLVNTKGRVVASAPIAKSAGKITANLGAGAIPTGMYFVRVNAKGADGKNIVRQTALSIVK